MISTAALTDSEKVAVSPLPPLRTSERQYWHDVQQYGLLLTEAEKEILAQRARAGDRQARQDICLSFLFFCNALAYRYARAYDWACPRIEYQDLAQLAEETVLDVMDVALSKKEPFTYIVACVRRAVISHTVVYASLIATPLAGRKKDRKPFIPVESLDKPKVDEEGNPYRLSDLLADTLMDLPSNDEDYPLLNTFLDALPEVQREIVLAHHGMREHAPESLFAIAKRRGVRPASVEKAYERAVTNLKWNLREEELRSEAKESGRPLSMQLQASRGLLGDVSQRLAQAYQTLSDSPGSMTIKRLARQAHCSDAVARSFLVELGKLPKKPEGSGQSIRSQIASGLLGDVSQRLAQAYQVLTSSPGSMTIRRLSKLAHCGDDVARDFLIEQGVLHPRSKGSEPSIRSQIARGLLGDVSQRLAQAYQVLTSSPGSMTIKRLSQQAHCNEDAARDFLIEQGVLSVRPKGEVEDRLLEAYQSLKSQPGSMTVKRLAQQAHCRREKASAFLVSQGVREP